MEEDRGTKNAQACRKYYAACKANPFACQDCGKMTTNVSLSKHRNTTIHKLAVRLKGREDCHRVQVEGRKTYSDGKFKDIRER